MVVQQSAMALSSTAQASTAGCSDEQKLQLYALYKQAVQGDVQDGQPWAVQAIARAKWDAWKTEVRLPPA